MRYKPHIMADHIKGQQRVQRCAVMAVLAWKGLWFVRSALTRYKII